MSSKPSIYRIGRSDRAGELHIERAWVQDAAGPLAGIYAHLVQLSVNGAPILIATDRSGQAVAFRFSATDPWLTPVPSYLELESRYDLIEPFTIGNIPHVLAYSSAEGHFDFYPISADLRAASPYRYSRVRGAGVTTGFDVAQPIDLRGAVYYLCYSSESGHVHIYSLAVTATSLEDAPPLVSDVVWVHQWARKWTRFAFFNLGGGSFFLKTNVGRLNVNIDKVLDNPRDGTAEIGTQLELQHALDLDIVRPFYLAGEPYFLTYMKDGSTTLNRFRSDCQGWTTEASLSTLADASHIVPIQLGDACYVLFC